MKNKKTALKVTIGILVGFIVIVFGVYMFAAIYFKTHFYSGTKINGMNCTGDKVEAVNQKLEQNLKEYTLVISGRNDKLLSVTGASINLSYADNEDAVQKIMDAQKPYSWIKALSENKEYTIDYTLTYDEESLKKILEASSLFDKAQVQAPADAYVEETSTGYSVVPEVLGDQLDETIVLQAVKTAIESGESHIELDNSSLECYVKPAIYSTDESLINKVSEMNRYVNTSIEVLFEDRKETITPEMIKEWLVENEDGTVSVNRDDVYQYVYNLAYEYDTFGLSREFKTFAGNIVTLPAGGDYGWAMDKDATTDLVLAAIEQGGAQSLEPEYVFSAMSRAENDLGGTYVEISIQEQRMWVYQDGKVAIDTPIITGLPTPDRETQVGIYAIDAKKEAAVLGTIEVQGYSQPVDYWMPFNGGQGIHDADRWKHGVYGGELYKTAGSHGCVNVSLEVAAKTFDIVQIGTAVVVY